MDRAKKDREEYRLALKMRKKGLNGGVEVVDGKTEDDDDDDGAEGKVCHLAGLKICQIVTCIVWHFRFGRRGGSTAPRPKFRRDQLQRG